MSAAIPPPPLPGSTSRLPVGLAWQGSLVLFAALLALLPPARGAMLLVPVLPADAAMVETAGFQGGATFVGVGPLPGSRYVLADRARLLPIALRRGMILLSGRPPLCGSQSENP